MMINLHNHSHYSSLDGSGKIEELVARTKELGQQALAITDHGNMFGVYDLYECCKSEGIQPIYGIEFYHVHESVERRMHLICFAKNMNGLRNLYKLHKLSYDNQIKGNFGKYYPIVTYKDLFEHKEDIIVSTACLAGHIPQLILSKNYNDLYYNIELLKKHFGDDLYLELQSNSIAEQTIVNAELMKLSKLYNIKPIVTNDTHYVLKEDAIVHEMLLCIQTKNKMDNPDRFKFSTQDFWLKSEEEIINSTHGIDTKEIEYCIQNTNEIASKCKFDLELPSKDEVLPKYSTDEKKELRKLVTNGWKEKKHGKTIVEKDRANYELEIVEQKGYSGYYLIVADYINWAKNNNILVGGGRGSGAGSFIAYLTGMTSINAIEHKLLFERFLNPERYTNPDWDCDFSDRSAVVQYLKERWGYDNVSDIIAFGKLTAKSVIRKVLSIHNFSMIDINKVNSSLPKKLNLTLKDCEESELFNEYKKKYPDLFNAMYRLEGVIDHITTHAAGVLITPNPIYNYAPLIYDQNTGNHVVGFDKYMLESLGMYKFDILKLTSLNVIDDCINMIQERHGVSINFDTISKDDELVYESLCSGNVFGVFQLAEQPEITKLIQPKDFEALIALNALVRPGVGDIKEYVERMNGKEYKKYSDLEDSYMNSTYGTITYQEQFMLRVNKLAGWSLGKGDSLRKVKNIRTNSDLKNSFIEDSLKLGNILSPSDAEQAWEEIVDALEGGYSFNRSHACSYADITYQTAWLKVHYPLEFMCALMSQDATDVEAISKRIVQCKQLGIKVLPPHINKSADKFVIEDGNIRCAISVIKGVGETAINEILSKQPFSSLDDLLSRTDKKVCDKTTVIGLIKSGAFEGNKIDLIVHYLTQKKDKKTLAKYKEVTYDNNVNLSYEKESLGFYLTSSPLDNYNFQPLDSYQDGGKAYIGGEVVKSKVITDKNKRPMAFLTISTQYNNVEAVVFANQFDTYKDIINDSNVIMIQGKRNGEKILANEITKLL